MKELNVASTSYFDEFIIRINFVKEFESNEELKANLNQRNSQVPRLNELLNDQIFHRYYYFHK